MMRLVIEEMGERPPEGMIVLLSIGGAIDDVGLERGRAKPADEFLNRLVGARSLASQVCEDRMGIGLVDSDIDLVARLVSKLEDGAVSLEACQPGAIGDEQVGQSQMDRAEEGPRIPAPFRIREVLAAVVHPLIEPLIVRRQFAVVL